MAAGWRAVRCMDAGIEKQRRKAYDDARQEGWWEILHWKAAYYEEMEKAEKYRRKFEDVATVRRLLKKIAQDEAAALAG